MIAVDDGVEDGCKIMTIRDRIGCSETVSGACFGGAWTVAHQVYGFKMDSEEQNFLSRELLPQKWKASNESAI